MTNRQAVWVERRLYPTTGVGLPRAINGTAKDYVLPEPPLQTSVALAFLLSDLERERKMKTYIVTEFRDDMFPRPPRDVCFTPMTHEEACDLAFGAMIVSQGLITVQTIINNELTMDLESTGHRVTEVVLDADVRILLARYNWSQVSPGASKVSEAKIEWWWVTTSE